MTKGRPVLFTTAFTVALFPLVDAFAQGSNVSKFQDLPRSAIVAPTTAGSSVALNVPVYVPNTITDDAEYNTHDGRIERGVTQRST